MIRKDTTTPIYHTEHGDRAWPFARRDKAESMAEGLSKYGSKARVIIRRVCSDVVVSEWANGVRVPVDLEV